MLGIRGVRLSGDKGAGPCAAGAVDVSSVPSSPAHGHARTHMGTATPSAAMAKTMAGEPHFPAAKIQIFGLFFQARILKD